MHEKKSFFCLSRRLFLIGLIGCCTLLAIAYYQEFAMGLQPCLLCNIQRLCLFTLAFIFFLGSILPSIQRHRRYLGLATLAFSIVGALMAGRQVWLESQPSSAEPQCLPGIDYIRQLPAGEIWQLFLKSTANCGVVQWRFLGLSIAVWSLICFILLSLLSLWLILQRKSQSQ